MLKAFAIAALSTTSLAFSEKATAETAAFSVSQKAEVNKLIEAYLDAHPEKIVAGLEKFGKDQQAAAIKKLEDVAKENKETLVNPANAIVVGKAEAPAKLVIFVDPNCGHCRNVSTAINETSLEGKNVAILIRQWPILGPDSEFISAALIAANKKDPAKYKQLSEKIVSSQKQLTKEMFLEIAKEAGLEAAALEKEATAVNGQVNTTKELAVKMGLEGTPTAFLADKTGIHLVQVGNKEMLQKVIADAKA